MTYLGQVRPKLGQVRLVLAISSSSSIVVHTHDDDFLCDINADVYFFSFLH